MRRRPVAVYRVIDEEELLGEHAGAPYVATVFEDGAELAGAVPARPRRIARWVPTVSSLTGLAVIALLLLTSSTHPAATHSRAQFDLSATVGHDRRDGAVGSRPTGHGAAPPRVAPSHRSILTVKRVPPPRPNRYRPAHRVHVPRERTGPARRRAERALRTAGPLEDHPAIPAAATATADTAADPSQEFGFER